MNARTLLGMPLHPSLRDVLARGAGAGRVLVLVVPCFNEEAAIRPFLDGIAPVRGQLTRRFGVDTEILFVDDGSTDRTRELVLAAMAADTTIRLVGLSRNFGKEVALTAGLEHANGDAVVPIDVDLQDPPATLVPMVEKWLEGWPVVQAVRTSRRTDGPLKRLTAHGFYSLMARLSRVPIEPNVGDFQLLSRAAVGEILRYPERTRFMKGLTASIGLRRAVVAFERAPRAAGRSKFNYWKLWNFALDGITSFSTLPLRVWTYIGALAALAAFGWAGWTAIRTLVFGVVTPGYASILVLMLFLGGLQLMGLGIIGEYIGRIATEVRARPLYHADLVAGGDMQGRHVR